MRVLVTGGAGFIGSHVVDQLIERGDTVLVIDDLSSGDFGWIPDDCLVRCDIRSQEAADAILRFRPECMVLLAAQMSVRVSMDDPMRDAETNVLALIRMLEAGMRAGCTRFVGASSGGTIYGDVSVDEQPITEDAPRSPLSFYGITKSAMVDYFSVFERAFGVDTVALAFGNVYGPRQNPYGEAGVIAIFGERVLKGLPCVINGDGKNTRDYVYVSDVAKAVVEATQFGSGLINIGSGVGTSVLEIHARVRRAADVSQNVEAVHAPALPGEVRAVALDIQKARRELRWQPKVGLDMGIPLVVQWLEERAKGRKL